MPDNAGDVDDRSAALCLKDWYHRLHAFDSPEEVSGKESAAFFHGHRRHGIAHAIAGVVDPDIDPAEAVFASANKILDLLPILHVAGDGRSPVCCPNSGSGLFQAR